MQITVTLYTNRDELEWKFPARWEVCPECDGRATTTRHIECDGGGFTASEWADACDDDPGDYDEPGFREKYFGGFYDRPCPVCKGRSTIQVIDEDFVTGWRDKIALKAYRAQERDSAEIDAIHAAERRMGA